MIIQNIENKIKFSLIISLTSIVGSIIIAIIGIVSGYSIAQSEKQRIYVLQGDMPHLAFASDREISMEIEAKSLVKTFHSLFFTLPPDDDFIKRNLSEAMYLIDESGLKQKNALTEKGFYANILSASVNFSIQCDSITINKDSLSFVYYGTQRIERKSSITKRQLITAGRIKDMPRTDHNPFGYIIIDYRTILNKDISVKENYQ